LLRTWRICTCELIQLVRGHRFAIDCCPGNLAIEVTAEVGRGCANLQHVTVDWITTKPSFCCLNFSVDKKLRAVIGDNKGGGMPLAIGHCSFAVDCTDPTDVEYNLFTANEECLAIGLPFSSRWGGGNQGSTLASFKPHGDGSFGSPEVKFFRLWARDDMNGLIRICGSLVGFGWQVRNKGD